MQLLVFVSLVIFPHFSASLFRNFFTFRNEVIACRERLWPKQQFKADQDLKDAESIKLSDKKRRAKERQRKMLESFVFQQEEFAKNNLDVGGK